MPTLHSLLQADHLFWEHLISCVQHITIRHKPAAWMLQLVHACVPAGRDAVLHNRASL